MYIVLRFYADSLAQADARDSFTASAPSDTFPYPVGIVWQSRKELGCDFPLTFCTTQHPDRIVYEVAQWSETALTTLYPVFPEQHVVAVAFHIHAHTPDLGEQPQRTSPPSASALREYLKKRLIQAICMYIVFWL